MRIAEDANRTRGDIEELYLDLLARQLTRFAPADACRPIRSRALDVVQRYLARHDAVLARRRPFDPSVRTEGRDWPAEAETMIGLRRLGNIRACVSDVVRSGVEGDLLEAGTWRGGAAIFMRGVLEALGDERRVVWVADSFAGLPKPDPERYPQDAGDQGWREQVFAVSLEEVTANFERYGLLDERVRFIVGWFRDSLPTAPVDQLAVLRLDGDMYESTIVALESLYPKVSPGGYVIVDDYGVVPGCRAAVEDFRARAGIADPLRVIDFTGVYWQRT